jgi:hypothetical protein
MGEVELREALINAKYALEYWQREARIAVRKGERWVNGPLERGLDEIERIEKLLAVIPAKP